MFRVLPVAGAAVVVAEASGMSASRQGESGEHFFSGVKFAHIILGVGLGHWLIHTSVTVIARVLLLLAWDEWGIVPGFGHPPPTRPTSRVSGSCSGAGVGVGADARVGRRASFSGG